MKVAIVLFQKDRGGVDSYLKTLIREWPKSDEIILITNKTNKGIKVLEELISEKRIQVRYCPSYDLDAGLLRKIFRFLNLPIYLHFLSLKYRSFVKKFSDHKIMIQNGTYPGSLDGLAFLKASRDLGIEKRMMVVHHGAIHGRMRKMFFASWVDLSVHQWATDLVTVSRATRKTLIDYFGFDPSINPIRVVHNSVQVNGHPNGKQFLSKTEKDFKLGIVGRVERYKGHEDLIMALSFVDSAKRESISVHIVGEGHEDEIQRLTKLAENLGVLESITFEGFIPGEACDIISELDILFMLTKDFEGFGLTIAEAMSIGTPVITTRVGAVEEFTNESLVTYVEPESPRDIAKAIENFLKNRDHFLEKSELAKKVISDYHPTEMVRNYRTLLSV